MGTHNAERMNQLAREFKHEHQAHLAALDTRPNVHHIGGNWAMGRDEDGNAVIVPDTRITRKPPRMSLALRRLMAAFYLATAALVVTGLYHLAPAIFRLFVALVPHSL